MIHRNKNSSELYRGGVMQNFKVEAQNARRRNIHTNSRHEKEKNVRVAQIIIFLYLQLQFDFPIDGVLACKKLLNDQEHVVSVATACLCRFQTASVPW